MDNININNNISDISENDNSLVEPKQLHKLTNLKWLLLLAGFVLLIILGFFVYKFLILGRTKKLVNISKNEEIIENVDEASNSQNAFSTLIS